MFKQIIKLIVLTNFLLLPSFYFSLLANSADLSEIQRRGKLIVGVKDNLRPLGFKDENGKLQGLEIDIAKRLAEELLGDSNAIILQPVTNQERIEVLLEDKVDIVIARMTLTASRSRLINFSPYYYLDGTGIITKNSNINGLEDLNNKTIAILNNSSTIAVIKNAIPNNTFKGVDSYQEALYLLELGEVDAFAADNSVLSGWIQEYPQYKQLSVRLSGEALCIGLPKGLQYVQLQLEINQAIARWRKSGWLNERIMFWGLPVSY